MKNFVRCARILVVRKGQKAVGIFDSYSLFQLTIPKSCFSRTYDFNSSFKTSIRSFLLVLDYSVKNSFFYSVVLFLKDQKFKKVLSHQISLDEKTQTFFCSTCFVFPSRSLSMVVHLGSKIFYKNQENFTIFVQIRLEKLLGQKWQKCF